MFDPCRSIPFPIVCAVNYLYSMIYSTFDLKGEGAAGLGTVGERSGFASSLNLRGILIRLRSAPHPIVVEKQISPLLSKGRFFGWLKNKQQQRQNAGGSSLRSE
jgi:hypothetical protein